MAQKRMFDKTIADSDDFLDMPLTTQALYFHLNIRADDDGFIDNCNSIMRVIGAKEDDFKLLVLKRYLILFESKVCVVRHWLIHNTIRKDRYNPTMYINEKKQLVVDEKIYNLKDQNTPGNHLATNWQPSIEENSIEEYRKEESSIVITNNISTSNMDNETFGRVNEILEKEFGRFTTPLEKEKIKNWTYPVEIIKLAIAESVTNGVFYINYIDRIIYNWQKANVRTLQEAEAYIKKFRDKKNQNKEPDKEKEPSKWDKIRKQIEEEKKSGQYRGL